MHDLPIILERAFMVGPCTILFCHDGFLDAFGRSTDRFSKRFLQDLQAL